jgi:septum formation protein
MMEGGKRPPSLVLASGSPRRREILRQIGLSFRVLVPDVDEEAIRAPEPAELARRRALAKAEAVDAPGELVLAADTLVVRRGRTYGKPEGPAAAAAMLAELCGGPHDVWSGLALRRNGQVWSGLARTRVWLRAASPEEIAAYVATGEPLDKAGSYAAQGLGSVLVERVSGCFWNVVGLPVAVLVSGLRFFGYGPWP